MATGSVKEEVISVRMNVSLRESLDEHVEKAREYDARSQAIRHAVRELIEHD